MTTFADANAASSDAFMAKLKARHVIEATACDNRGESLATLWAAYDVAFAKEQLARAYATLAFLQDEDRNPPTTPKPEPANG